MELSPEAFVYDGGGGWKRSGVRSRAQRSRPSSRRRVRRLKSRRLLQLLGPEPGKTIGNGARGQRAHTSPSQGGTEKRARLAVTRPVSHFSPRVRSRTGWGEAVSKQQKSAETEASALSVASRLVLGALGDHLGGLAERRERGRHHHGAGGDKGVDLGHRALPLGDHLSRLAQRGIRKRGEHQRGDDQGINAGHCLGSSSSKRPRFDETNISPPRSGRCDRGHALISRGWATPFRSAP